MRNRYDMDDRDDRNEWQQGRFGRDYNEGRFGRDYNEGRFGRDYNEGRFGRDYNEGRLGRDYNEGRFGRDYGDRDYDRSMSRGYGDRGWGQQDMSNRGWGQQEMGGRGYYGQQDMGNRGYYGQQDLSRRGYHGQQDMGNRGWGQQETSGRGYYGQQDMGNRGYSGQQDTSGRGYSAQQDMGNRGWGQQQGWTSSQTGYGGQWTQTGGMERTSLMRGRGPKGYKRSDDRIREDVCDRLTDHHDIDASEIEVRVQNGEVTLTGTVTERRQKHAVEQLIESLPGVADVHNQIRVKREEMGAGTSMTGRAGASDQQRTTTADRNGPTQQETTRR
jgi:osmotically-inducible protein OsmY